MKKNLNFSDAQVNNFDNIIRDSRFQVDLNTMEITDNFIAPLKKQLDEFKLQNKGALPERLSQLEKQVTRLDEVLTGNLGKYVNRRFEIFKKDGNPLSSIFKNS